MKVTKPLFLFLFICTLSSSSFAQSLAYKVLLEGLYDKNFPVVKPDQIKDLGDYQVIDARELDEFEVSHLPGALWVGYENFSLQKIKSLDKEKPVLVYCTVGSRSEEIGKKIREAGFDQVYNLYGGIIHWANESQPLVVEGNPTKRVHTYTKTWGIWLNKGVKVY
jgi:rhodanese-related sulfurtransferase